MARISHLFPNTGNDYCPQTLFAYGAYKEDGTPNFGLFCWFSYCWTDNFGVMACIGEPKLTQDLIRKNRVFSANLITEKLLPLADYFGSTSGHSPDKMNIPFQWEKGAALDVPVLSDSPVVFELEAEKIIELNEQGSVLLVCKIHNVLHDEMLDQEDIPLAEKMAKIAPVSTTCATYFDWKGNPMANWGQLAPTIRK